MALSRCLAVYDLRKHIDSLLVDDEGVDDKPVRLIISTPEGQSLMFDVTGVTVTEGQFFIDVEPTA